ncbi:MAG: DEAD/DEAH box helicase, partial [Chloroflexi bacterium]|nr:DEAD/DEAH box helicase [Chloroflexota bacterium]
FVPLIMALRLPTVRLLIADDVGVGKTIEAALIARELLDRGLARRLAVLCPAHLCDQWATELREKFGLDPRVVQPSQIARLQRELPRQDLSIYQHYPYLVASVDFVKSDRQADAFVRNAPDLVIVDEAHTAARPRGDRDRSQHERHTLVRRLADDPGRHLLLVTATPHSGIEESFRSLLGLIRPELDAIGPAAEAELDRRRLLPYVVQRRRSDLVRWLGAETPFPERRSEERTYTLSERYYRLFEDVLAYCRESVSARTGLRAPQQRVRHWAAIALLRCLLSSPDAADAVLGKRAGQRASGEEAELVPDEIDATYRPQVLDVLDEENVGDYVPSAPVEDAEPSLSDAERRRLAAFRREAEALAGTPDDRKLMEAAGVVAGLLRGGFRPIVFCRFISTARYLEKHLPGQLGPEFPGLRVAAVTGELGDEERREKVAELVEDPVRALVATDCLSEGINLQDHFDAVLHYDLPWNPNRLEQREGRVDRFGQRRPEVRIVLLYGANNPADLVVLEVLIRKAQTIRKRLGISVPVPAEPEQVMQAVVDNVLLRGRAATAVQLQLALETPEVSRLHAQWEAAAEREGKERAYFAQRGIQPDEVDREIKATDPVLGTPETVETFLADAAQRFGGHLRGTRQAGVFDLDPGSLRPTLAERGFGGGTLRVSFDRLKDEKALALGRTHPVVAAFCDAVLGAALAPEPDERFARCGATLTDAVGRRTAVVLLRLRYLLREEVEEFAEEVALAAFQRDHRELSATYLEPARDTARDLLRRARPVANLTPAERREHVAWALDLLQRQTDWYASIVEGRVARLQESHRRIRALVRASRLEVVPRTPPDILGCYVLVPSGGGR